MIFLPVLLSVVDTEPATPRDGVLIYNPADPYAVGLNVSEPGFGNVPWLFARDLLADGASTGVGAGDGDVRVWKCQQGSVHITVISPEGHANLHISAKEVTGFLKAAYIIVPRGRELAAIDMDRELASLFGEAA